MKLLKKISDFIMSLQGNLDKVAKFVIGWIIAFDLFAGTFIPIAYGQGCGWFAIPNLLIDIYVIVVFVKWLKDEGLD